MFRRRADRRSRRSRSPAIPRPESGWPPPPTTPLDFTTRTRLVMSLGQIQTHVNTAASTVGRAGEGRITLPQLEVLKSSVAMLLLEVVALDTAVSAIHRPDHGSGSPVDPPTVTYRAPARRAGTAQGADARLEPCESKGRENEGGGDQDRAIAPGSILEGEFQGRSPGSPGGVWLEEKRP